MRGYLERSEQQRGDDAARDNTWPARPGDGWRWQLFALTEILKELAIRNPSKISALAEAVRGRTRNLIARSVAEINPARPDLARSVEFAPGWLIGPNISNREKMAIVRTACEIFGLRMPEDIDLTLPNAP